MKPVNPLAVFATCLLLTACGRQLRYASDPDTSLNLTHETFIRMLIG